MKTADRARQREQIHFVSHPRSLGTTSRRRFDRMVLNPVPDPSWHEAKVVELTPISRYGWPSRPTPLAKETRLLWIVGIPAVMQHISEAVSSGGHITIHGDYQGNRGGDERDVMGCPPSSRHGSGSGGASGRSAPVTHLGVCGWVAEAPPPSRSSAEAYLVMAAVTGVDFCTVWQRPTSRESWQPDAVCCICRLQHRPSCCSCRWSLGCFLSAAPTV